jgi:hypothetical protein
VVDCCVEVTTAVVVAVVAWETTLVRSQLRCCERSAVAVKSASDRQQGIDNTVVLLSKKKKNKRCRRSKRSKIVNL